MLERWPKTQNKHELDWDVPTIYKIFYPQAALIVLSALTCTCLARPQEAVVYADEPPVFCILLKVSTYFFPISIFFAPLFFLIFSILLIDYSF